MDKYKKHKKGFTLAEVLITLSIIGVIAAILFPSILANYNERTLKAKRQALVARMSQAMGELSGEFKNYEDLTCPPDKTGTYEGCVDNGSAVGFISKGLSSVYKIAAVCDTDGLAACDFPESITLLDNSKFSFENIKSFIDYNPQLYTDVNTLSVNAKAAAFMTKNGESVLLFLNPRCSGKEYGTFYFTETKICVNMIYDLNGAKKKPNKMGEDIGFMSVFYSDSPYLAAPNIINPDKLGDYDTTIESTPGGDREAYLSNAYNFEQAKAVCASIGSNVTLPTVEEMMSIIINTPIARDLNSQKFSGYIWSNSYCNPEQPYAGLLWKYMPPSDSSTDAWNGRVLGTYCMNPTSSSSSFGAIRARCVYRD